MLFIGIFAVVRFADLSTRGALGYMFANAYETPFFWIEIALFIIIPLVLLFNKRLRSTPRGLFIASLSVVLGFLMHRMNVVTTAFAKVSGGYFPSWQEFLVSTTFIAAGFIIVGLIARNFPLFESAAPATTETADEEEYVKIGWCV
jgi:Ni/Fe-hydrogenase subunit HybB-like protein